MTRIRRTLGLAAVLAGAAALAAPAAAHHSFAMFDKKKTVTLKGTVKEFQWVNPHSWLHVNVPGADGKVVEWKIEGRSPNVLSRRGWRRDLIKAGDKVSVVIYPMKDGSAMGAIVRVTLPNGMDINADTPGAVDTDEEGPRK